MRRPPTRSQLAIDCENVRRKREQAEIIDQLENPSLEIDSNEPGFDPYDSGAFDRRQAWTGVRRR